MSFKHWILSATYHPLRLWNGMLGVLGSRPRLRVLLYHDIAPTEEVHFAAQLRWLSRSWNFVTPEQFSKVISGDERIEHDSLLISFDDGFSSNRKIAETVLNPMGIQALFFVVSDFVSLTDEDSIKNLIAKNIYLNADKNNLPEHCRNMNWEDLKFLLANGHTIGAHTLTHERLSELTGSALKFEIVDSANILQERLGVSIDHFAYTFGDLASFSAEALKLAQKRFDFVYTGLRGYNVPGIVQPWAIRRDSITATDPISLVGAFLEGSADFLYKSDLKKYETWGGE